jgi:indolepyruvate ferredoxin oxidoreductase alpha subunit
MEKSFSKEIQSLKLGDGDEFQGEGILAITKALLQSGVSYVGGYQGAPVSHLLDVMVQATEYMSELGIHVAPCSNEASAAAMLGASIHYPVRGAVTWKSIVGTNVAADALSNLSSPGVTGGAMIVVGEDYGEGASVIQERTYAFALKSTMLLIDPRPDLQTMVRLVEEGFSLSEVSNMPVMVELRIRTCHVRGSFKAKDNIAPQISTNKLMQDPAQFDYSKLAHPPVTFVHEKLKQEQRIPAARQYIMEHKLNEVFAGERSNLGIVVQGGLYNTLVRALTLLGLSDHFGESEVPILVLNVIYPLVPDELVEFCRGKEKILVVEEGAPEFIELEIIAQLSRRRLNTQVHGKDLFAISGEYKVDGVSQGVERFLSPPDKSSGVETELIKGPAGQTGCSVQPGNLSPLPPRPPGFCIGCPERPVFSALKQNQKQFGKVHVAADIGCHSFGTFDPFGFGHSILGYGMSLASRAGVSPMMNRRVLSIMGDGGFWHNGLLTGVQSALFNGDDAVLIIFKNGYTSATGTQDILSTPDEEVKASAPKKQESLVDRNKTIEETLRGIGVEWIRTVYTYDVERVKRILDEAFTTRFDGLKIIVAEGECQLERQRRIRPWIAALKQHGERYERVKYGIDDDVCSGDHACMRISGCPSLTLKDNPDPLKEDPVATISDGCVGCGLCGENAHSATLCPSFYRAEIVKNPKPWERVVSHLSRAVMSVIAKN